MSKWGRPPGSKMNRKNVIQKKRVSIYVDKKSYDDLKDICHMAGFSLSSMVSRLIEDAMFLYYKEGFKVTEEMSRYEIIEVLQKLKGLVCQKNRTFF
jgi:hypothetical protein